jgi:cellulose synthase (UDP-forming)
MTNWRIRLIGLVLIAAMIWYIPWMLVSMNQLAWWLSVPFVAANLLILTNVVVTLINNWYRATPKWHAVSKGEEPFVAVLIATYGEPVLMVERTIRSVLEQNWPAERLGVIVGDDGHSPKVAAVVARLQAEYPSATILYHEPPPKGDPWRRGDAKAGNLNACLAYALQLWGDVAYVETRDADDEVGDANFLRECVGQLIAEHRAAFVQTVKDAHVSRGDPFGNLEGFFYRGAMLGRHAANAVFPCGSGLVWRREALIDIGGFPTWNLVEDLQSGVEALRRGWRGIYLPIVGASAQHAPEDIPNLYKQRGTWALDTMRLLFWGRLRGLSLRQRLQFIEMGLFYLQSLSNLTILLTLVTCFTWGVYPLVTDSLSYALHFWPLVIAIELFAATLNWPQPYEALLRSREMWTGLAPVYAKACLLALLYGPRRKPTYRVTRKSTLVAWYWRETLLQIMFVVLLLAAMLYGLATHPSLATFDVGSAYWVLFYVVFLCGFIRKGWFGVGSRRKSRARKPVTKEVTVPHS